MLTVASKVNDLDRQEDLLEKVKAEVEAKGTCARFEHSSGYIDACCESVRVAMSWSALIKPLLISCAVPTGRRSIVVCADVTKEDEVAAMVATTVDQLGELNVSTMSKGAVFSAGNCGSPYTDNMDNG